MFNGTQNIFDYTTSEIIEVNLKYWLDQSFLDIGAYFTVNVPESGLYGGDKSRLFPIEDLNYEPGQVWQTFHNNLVWEREDLRPSGIYINNTFYTSGFNVDYVRGKVILDEKINPTNIVNMNFSYKYINLYSDTEIDWFSDIQSDSSRIDNMDYVYGSGEVYNRMQLPALIYETVDKSFRPYQLGLGQYTDNVILMRVFAQSKSEVDRIADILSEQNEKTIFLFDAQLANSSGKTPLNNKGFLNSEALNYNELIIPKEDGGYRWRKMTFFKGVKQERDNLKNNLFHRAVRFRAELVLTDI